MTAFGMEAHEAGRFSDVLASASSSANTNVAMLGESFKYVAPVAGALGYSVEDTALALGLMANAGIKASQSGTSLRSALTNMVKPTKAMQNVMDDLGINIKDANGEMKPMEVLLRDLRTAFSTLTDDQKASAAATLFGKEAMAGMLAILNASEEDFNSLSQAINNSNGVAQEMAETMQNNLKGQLTNLKSALEELAIKLYDTLEPSLRKIVGVIQDIVDRMNNLSPTAQKIIVGIGVLVASLGPLLVIGGTILTGLGAFMTVLPALLPMISALAGPIGIVIGAITALGVAYALTAPKADEHLKQQRDIAQAELDVAKAQTENIKKMHESVDATTEKAQKTLEAIKTNDKLIDSFERLADKNKLTNNELLEFKTLQSDLEHTTSPEAIAKIQERMEELKVKSGLTNEEFNEFMSTQDTLAQKLPESALLYDEYGNAIITARDSVRDLTKAELERMQLEVYEQMLDDVKQINEAIDDTTFSVEELIEKEQRVSDLTDDVKQSKKEVAQLTADQQAIDAEILALGEGKNAWEKATNLEYQKQKNELLAQKAVKNKQLKKAEKNLAVQEETLELEKGIVDEYKEQNKQTIELIKKSNMNYDTLVEILSAQSGINLEKGKELQQLDEAIKKKDTEIAQLEEQKKKHGDKNGEIQKQIDKVNEENRLLKEGKNQLGLINGELETANVKQTEKNKNIAKEKEAHIKSKKAIQEKTKEAEKANKEYGKDVKKTVEVKQTKDPDEENSKWSKGITKVVKLVAQGKQWLGYAEGTNFHPGGEAFMGEEGFEIFKANGKYGIANFGLYDLPVGAKVWTHDESKEMLKGITSGLNMGVQATKASTGNLPTQNHQFQITPAPVFIDGQQVAEITFDASDKLSGEKLAIESYMKGV